MSDDPQFDFWYAINNTTVLRLPPKRLETFGETLLRYRLITELMDEVGAVRVREGEVQAFRPEILTPNSFSQTALEGFEEESRKYMDWLREHRADLLILRYGFSVQNKGVSEHTVHAPLQAVIDDVLRPDQGQRSVEAAVLVGVDQPWQVCLLKLMVDVVQQSAGANAREFRSQQNLLQSRTTAAELERQVDAEFRLAMANPGRLDHLRRWLQEKGVFEAHQDRFFSIVRQMERQG